MDNFTKITTGYVRQYYECNENGMFVCTGQAFIAGDVVEFVDDGDNNIPPQEHEYQPYNMTLEE